MPPTALTTPQKSSTAYTYKIRTMAADIESLKKGQSPAGSVVVLEPPPAIPPTGQIQIRKESAKIFEFPGPPPSQTRPPFSGPISSPFQPHQAPEILEKPQPLVQKMEPLTQQTPLKAGPPTAQNLPPAPPLPPRPMSPPPSLPPLPPLPPRPSVPPMPAHPATPPSPITGSAPMNLPSANFPSPTTPLRTGPPGAPPPLPTLPAIYGSRTKKKGMIILLAGAAVVVIFIIGEIWWFFLKPATAPPTPTNETNNILLPPRELQPLLPPQETLPATPVQETLVLPQALLNYDRTETISVGSISPPEIAAAINDFDTTTIGTDELVRLVIKTENTEISLDQNQPSANNLATLENIAAGLKLKIPSAIKNELLENYDLFIYGSSEFDKEICQTHKNTSPSCSGPRLGLALKINGEAKINSALKVWEKTMASDLRNLILAKTISSGQFQTGIHQDQTIRYKNLPISTTAIEYALVNGVLIIGTSKSSTLKAIDAIAIPENPNNSESQNIR